MSVFLLVFVSFACAQTPVLLSSVQSLTLKAGHHTTSRRGPPVPQVECVGGDCDRGAQHVKVIQCINKGADSFGVPQWECKAELPVDWRLGTTDVSCEGYSSAEDPFILAGSCGVEYSIHGPPTGSVRVGRNEEEIAKLQGRPIPAKAPEERPVLTLDANDHAWKPIPVKEDEKSCPPPLTGECSGVWPEVKEEKPAQKKVETPRPPPVQDSGFGELLLWLALWVVIAVCVLTFFCCVASSASPMAPQPRPVAVPAPVFIPHPAPVSIPPPGPVYAHPAVVVTPMPTPAVPMAPVYPPPPPVCTMASAPIWSRSPSPVRNRRPRTPSPPRREEPESTPPPVKTHTSTGYGTTKRR